MAAKEGTHMNDQKQKKRLFGRKKEPVDNSMPPLDTDDSIPDRGGHGALWVTALCVVAAAALLISSLPSGVVSGTSVQSRVLTAQPENKAISTALLGAGTLTPPEGEDLEIPQALELEARYAENGDTVRAGDPIVKVDKVAVHAAIAELQELMEDLDAAIAKVTNDSPSTSVKATASGRVKKIYAQKDRAVADTVYDSGALVLLSLDGTMAVDIPAQGLTLGQKVTLRLSDGKELEGQVETISDGLAAVTCSDEKAPYEDRVSVMEEGGKVLGTGQLYIHSMLRVTGAYGTVSYISVRENQKVTNGTTLLTLKDTGHTVEYNRLLNRRQELEEHMDKLQRLSKDGILRADTDGVVSGLDTTVDYVSPAGLETRTRSQASPGYISLNKILMDEVVEAPGNPDSDEGGNTGDSDPPDPSDPSGPSEPSEPTDPTGPSEDGDKQTATYVLGLVVENSGDTIYYIPQQTIEASQDVAQTMDLSSMVGPDVSQTPTALTDGGQTVLMSNGMSWSPSSFGAVAKGDAILIGTGLIVHQRALDISGMMPDLSGLDLSSLGGMTGGYSSGSYPASTPAYETYDTGCTLAATVTQTKEMTVDITVDELDILSLEVGMAADVTLDALPGQSFRGIITKINTYGVNSGGNTKYTVTVTLDRAEKMLTGMSASVSITTATSESVPTLPAAAIQSQNGKSWVYTAYDEKTDTLSGLTQVELGRSDGENVEILSGLDSGASCYYRYADEIEYRFVG